MRVRVDALRSGDSWEFISEICNTCEWLITDACFVPANLPARRDWTA
jgi:hypothetical protein